MENFNALNYMLDGFNYNLVDVKSIDETAAEIKSSGGFELCSKDTIPGVGYMALFKNVEGSVFGVLERDATAH